MLDEVDTLVELVVQYLLYHPGVLLELVVHRGPQFRLGLLEHRFEHVELGVRRLFDDSSSLLQGGALCGEATSEERLGRPLLEFKARSNSC